MFIFFFYYNMKIQICQYVSDCAWNPNHKNIISSPVPSYKCDASPYHNSRQLKELHRGNSASNPDNLFA